MDELCYQILGNQKSFVDYQTDLKKWMKQADAMKEMDEKNEWYCRNMFDYCISPLQHGLSAESVADTIGLYVGMSLFSKEFRNKVGPEIQKLTMPVKDWFGASAAARRDKAVARNLRFAAAIERRFGGERSSLEDCDPPAVPNRKVKWASNYIEKHYAGENMDAHKARMQKLADRIAMKQNRGRIPLTPETAALQKLNLMHNYYHQMRDPEINQDDLVEEYQGAMSTLDELIKRDGLDMDDVNRSMRTAVGQLTAAYPEYEKEFGALAFDWYVKADGVEVNHPSKKLSEDIPCRVWQGEYISRETGKPFNGGFAPRGPSDVDSYKTQMEKYFTDILGGMDTADKLNAALDSPWMEKVQNRFISMMNDDFKYYDEVNPLDTPRDPHKVFDEVVMNVFEQYGKTHPEVVEELVDRAQQAREARSEERCRGLDIDGDYGEGGLDYNV